MDKDFHRYALPDVFDADVFEENIKDLLPSENIIPYEYKVSEKRWKAWRPCFVSNHMNLHTPDKKLANVDSNALNL